MAVTKYTYAISTDTANGAINSDKLVKEIADSTIVTALHHVDITGDVLDILMKDALSTGDETALTTLVNAHDGIPLLTPELVTLTGTNTVAVIKPNIGVRAWLFSHNFSDKTTWYGDSVRITNETVGTGDGTIVIFNLDNQYIIDVLHGKISDEDYFVSTYAPVVKIDNIRKSVV